MLKSLGIFACLIWLSSSRLFGADVNSQATLNAALKPTSLASDQTIDVTINFSLSNGGDPATPENLYPVNCTTSLGALTSNLITINGGGFTINVPANDVRGFFIIPNSTVLIENLTFNGASLSGGAGGPNGNPLAGTGGGGAAVGG